MMMSRLSREQRQNGSAPPDPLDLLIRASLQQALGATAEAIPADWLHMLRAGPVLDGAMPDRD